MTIHEKYKKTYDLAYRYLVQHKGVTEALLSKYMDHADEKPYDDYFVLKDITRIAKHVDKTPYNVDKLFWLIGSGSFYLEEERMELGRGRDKFIEFAKKNLNN